MGHGSDCKWRFVSLTLHLLLTQRTQMSWCCRLGLRLNSSEKQRGATHQASDFTQGTYFTPWQEETSSSLSQGLRKGKGGIRTVMQGSIWLGDRDRCGGDVVKPCSIRDSGSVPLHQPSAWQTAGLLIIVCLINSLSSAVHSLGKCCGEGQGWPLTPGQRSEVLSL